VVARKAALGRHFRRQATVRPDESRLKIYFSLGRFSTTYGLNLLTPETFRLHKCTN
jgi:hypothetical protein